MAHSPLHDTSTWTIFSATTAIWTNTAGVLATPTAPATCFNSCATRGVAAYARIVYTFAASVLATPYAPITYSTLHAARGTTVSTTFMIAYFKGTLNAQASIGIR